MFILKQKLKFIEVTKPCNNPPSHPSRQIQSSLTFPKYFKTKRPFQNKTTLTPKTNSIHAKPINTSCQQSDFLPLWNRTNILLGYTTPNTLSNLAKIFASLILPNQNKLRKPQNQPPHQTQPTAKNARCIEHRAICIIETKILGPAT